MSITIHDVAKYCNVSVATVSRVVNNVDYPVSDKLRKKVQAAIKELNYKPNILAQNLKYNKSSEVGVIIPNISNYYYPDLVAGINDSLINSGYNVLLCNSYRNPKHEKAQFLFLLQKRVKGIIISTVSNDTSWIADVMPDDVSLIAIEQELSVPSHRVSFDYYQGGFDAAKYLAAQGHKKIAFFGPPLTYGSRSSRFEGFKAGLLKSGLELPSEFVRISDYEQEDENSYEFNIGRLLTEKMLETGELPTAIFCINDMLALGVIGALQRRGIKVPDDISVMGFDNLSISGIVNPSLTTVDQYMREIGSKAIEVLYRSFEHPGMGYETFEFQPKLVERESVLNIGGAK